MNEARRVVRAAGVIGAATFLSRVLGFVRDMVVARAFGASQVADAFYVAYRIPSLLRELFAEGSMSAAFVPVFTQTLTTDSREEARRLARAAFSLILVIVATVTVIGMAIAPWLVAVIAPGFGDDPGKAALTADLTRIMFPYLLWISLAALAMGVLNSVRAFAAPALSPALFNLAIIATVFGLAPLLAEPVLAVAWGVFIGGLAQLAVQIPSLQRAGMGLGWFWQPTHPGLAKMGALLIPTLVGLSVSQVNIFINTLLASYLAQGSVTYLYYAMRLVQFPLGVFGVALSTALLPTLSTHAAKQDEAALRETLAFGLRLILFITIPAMIGLIALRTPIIHVLFQHGRFTAADTAGTAVALLGYSVGLWAFAGVRVVVPVFYARQDTKTPVVVAAAAVLVNVGLSLVLMGPLAHGGLALATAIASCVNFTVLLVVLRTRLGPFGGRRVVRSAAIALVASAPAAVIGWGVSGLSLWNVPGAWTEKVALISVAIAASAGAYALLHTLWKTDEATAVWDLLKRRAARSRTT
ncbi:MAG TPA: murein biosynthesis integral membrane protein MurJ [Nitrospiria bacterium]|nr:murein biosynthesis integral membrane protein MurJ [Nitrospiria bacterium]